MDIDRNLVDGVAVQRFQRGGPVGLPDHVDLGRVRALDGLTCYREGLGCGDHQRRTRVLELIADLLGAVYRVDRCDAATRARDAVEDNRVLREIGCDQRQARPRPEAPLAQTPCELSYPITQLAERIAPTREAIHDRDPVAEFVGSP